MHVFVCSNSWLDVGYGARLQEYLLKTASVEVIYESAVERQFSTAQINTLISVIRKGIPEGNHESRFVSLRDKFDLALADRESRREVVRSRDQLIGDGLGTANRRGHRKYVGDKWGGKYLRAPDIYNHVLDKCGNKLVRLGDTASVRRGLTTGANDFFYLDPEKIARWGIESRFRKPIITSPKESRSIIVDTSALPNQVFVCGEEKEELTGTGALAYIKWGERQGF